MRKTTSTKISHSREIITNITDSHYTSDIKDPPPIFTQSHIHKPNNTTARSKNKYLHSKIQSSITHNSPSKKHKIDILTSTQRSSLPSPQIKRGESQSKFTRIINSSCQPKDRAEEKLNYHLLSIPNIIKKILKQKQPKMEKSKWIFLCTKEAATSNTKLLKSYNYDVEKATQSGKYTSLTYGSEFRPAMDLQPLLQHHTNWPAIKELIQNGVSYPLEPISEHDRIRDIEYMLRRGNHKSASITENKQALEKSFTKEVKYQWCIPLLPSCITSIPGASITPLGVAVQHTIDANNNRILKRRPTHDCSFPGISGNSCNLRVIKDELDECTYGHALLRFLHGIHHIRSRHPGKRILINKTDMDVAYRRLHANTKSATTCISVLNDIAYLLVRLPFGSSPAPPKFSAVSDAAADIAQDLAMDPKWNPTTLHSDFHLDSNTKPESHKTRAHNADTLAVELPDRNIITDNFIDDLFQACLDDLDNGERIKHAVPLVLHTFFRPSSNRDAGPRDPIINMTKHAAEGKLEEVKVILGWKIDTHLFRVFLTKEKAADWLMDIKMIIGQGHCERGKLETIIGRFNHTGVIIHISRYFLTRLRYRLQKYQKAHESFKIKLAPWDLLDMVLWKDMLTHLSRKGVSINNICHVAPSSTTYSDSCKFGIGGYTMQGPAWRYLIPENLRNRASINLLEFIGAIVTIHLSLKRDTHKSDYPHILAFTDSSSALGWMHHSTFNPVKDPNHDKTARYLARLLFENEASLYSEHIPGVHNHTADCLSRDFHLSNKNIISLIKSSAPPSQVPKNIHMTKLDPTISCWIASTLESMPLKRESMPKPSPSSLALSSNSKDSSKKETLKMTSSSRISPTPNANSSSQASPTQSEKILMAEQAKIPYSAALSVPPSPTWFRPSGRTYGLTPQGMQMGRKAPSSRGKSNHIKKTTQPRKTKHAYRSRYGTKSMTTRRHR